jgi:HK97 family phage portal protein
VTVALIDRIDRSRRRDISRVADPITLEEFSHLLASSMSSSTATSSGTSVGVNRVLGITAWYSGVRYIAETVSMLPWHHYLKRPDDSRDRRAPWPWLEKPDIEQTWSGWVEHQVMSLLHKGNGFSFKIRNFADQVVGLREIHPDRITGGCAPDGTKRFMVDHDQTPYTTREILHIPGIAYNGRFGLNPIRTLADALGIVAAADSYAGRFFGQSTNLGGIISDPVTRSPSNKPSTCAKSGSRSTRACSMRTRRACCRRARRTRRWR